MQQQNWYLLQSEMVDTPPPSPPSPCLTNHKQQPTTAREISSCFVSAASLPSSTTTTSAAAPSPSRAHGTSTAGGHATQQYQHQHQHQPSSSEWASSASGRYRVKTQPIRCRTCHNIFFCRSSTQTSTKTRHESSLKCLTFHDDNPIYTTWRESVEYLA